MKNQLNASATGVLKLKSDLLDTELSQLMKEILKFTNEDWCMITTIPPKEKPKARIEWLRRSMIGHDERLEFDSFKKRLDCLDNQLTRLVRIIRCNAFRDRRKQQTKV
jgi:hypothetical protein